jgi:hypothetical protein
LYAQSVQLVKEICARYGIPIDRAHIRKHKEVADPNNTTSCPDSLDIDRIVAMANGSWAAPITTITSEDDMIYVGPIHPITATFKTFAAGSIYRERTASSPGVANLAVGASVVVDAYCYSNSPVNCTDLDGKGTQGPDWLWWRTGGNWVPDAILATTPVLPTAPGPNTPATEKLDTLFATQAQLATIPASTPVDLGPLTTRVKNVEDKEAALEKAPIKPHKHDVTVTATTNYAGATTDTI